MPAKPLLLALLLLCLLLPACAGQRLEDPELLLAARTAATAHEAATPAWGSRPARVKAAITPESMALFPSMRGDLTLIGVYGNYPDGETRFALALPQGTRLGSCTRTPAGGAPKFRTLSPLAAVVNLVRASFYALDEFLAAAPRPDDAWRLQLGDARGAISRERVVLARYRSMGRGGYAKYIYDLDGRPLVFYRVRANALDWKLSFRTGEEKTAYVFLDKRRDWIINVEILEVRP